VSKPVPSPTATNAAHDGRNHNMENDNSGIEEQSEIGNLHVTEVNL
jgi:hypothetical protein